VLFVVVEGFGIGDDNVRAFAAGDDEFRVGGGEGFAIEQKTNMVIGVDLENGCGKDMRIHARASRRIARVLRSV
jgi:hypothetical protein